MRELIRRILRENLETKLVTGCDTFDKKSSNYKWCKFAEGKLRENKVTAYKAIQEYKKEFLSNYQTGLRAKLYNKEDNFFSERREVVIDALEKSKSCPSFYNYIIQQMTGFTQEFVILNAKGEYDLLNKLNSNWTALAVLLTLGVPEGYKDTKQYSISDAQKKFFKEKDDEGFTLFERIMNDWEKEEMGEIRDKIYSTIENTSREGQRIEDEFYNFIKKFVPSIQFAGEYSFMDMIGVDLMIEDPESKKWIPVQVKKFVTACDEVSSRKKNYREFMCENWCVSYEEDSWKIRTYKGKNLQKSKEQCKTKPLNLTCFLNIHHHETDHTECETEIERYGGEIGF